MSTETITDGTTTTEEVPATGTPETAPAPAPAAEAASSNGAGPPAGGDGGGGDAGDTRVAVPQTKWTRTNLALVALSAAGAAAWIYWSFSWVPKDTTKDTNLVLQWLLCLAILGAFTIGVGHALTGYWKSILIDDRNKASLSRLQMVLWTGIVLSAYATAVAWNRDAGSSTPLKVPIPQELWMLMGIATASLAGSVLIKEDQKKRSGDRVDKNAEKLAELQAAKGKNASELDRQRAEGDLAVYQTPAAARWTDIFKGETTNNYPYLDLGKVQMFFFTVVLVAMYALAIGTVFANTVGVDAFDFPVFDEAMIVLLGISHAGYLTLKAAKT